MADSNLREFSPRALQIALLVLIALGLGTRAAIAAGVTGTVVMWWGLSEPQHSFRLNDWDQALGIALYALIATLVVVLVHRVARAARTQTFQPSVRDAFIDGAPVGLAYLDENLRARFVNRELSNAEGGAFTDEQSGSPVDRGLRDLLNPLLSRVRNTQVPIVDENLALVVPNQGIDRHWKASIYPVAADQHTAAGLGIVLVDVTREVITQRRSRQLLEFADIVGGLATADELAHAVARFLAETFASRAAVGFVVDNGAEYEVYATAGFDNGQADEWAHRRLPMTLDLPIIDAARQGEIITVASREELVERYPDIDAFGDRDLEACVAVPLRDRESGGRVFGVLHVSWLYPRTITDSSRVTLLTVAAMVESASLRLGKTEQRAADRFRAALDAMVSTVTIARAVRDESGAIVDFVLEYINGPTLDATRRPSDELIERPVSALYPDWAESGMIDKLAKVVETGVATSEERVPFRDLLADGAQLDGVFSYQAVKFDDGYLLSSRDVTDAVRAEERTRELVAERRRREAVDALATLTTALASARTIADVSEAACAHGANAAGADFITVAVRHDDRQFMVRISEGVTATPPRNRVEFPVVADTPFARALEQGDPIFLERLSDFRGRGIAMADSLIDAGVVSVALVPVLDNDRTLGALGFGWSDHQRFTTHLDRRIETVADVVSAAMRRVAAEEESAARRSQTEALARLTAGLSAAIDTDGVWRAAAELVPAVFSVTMSATARLNDRGDALLFTDTGRSDATDADVRTYPTAERAPLTDAIRDRTVLVFNSRDAMFDAYPDLPEFAWQDWGALGTIPVASDTAALGVLALARPIGRTFDGYERNLLVFVQALLAQAATRAELFERERSRRRLSEAFQRAGVEVLAPQNADPASTIARSVAHVLQAERFAAYVVEDRGLLRVDAESPNLARLREVILLSESLPPAEAVRSGRPVVLATDEDWRTHYPDAPRYAGILSISLPLHGASGEVVMVVSLGYPTAGSFPPGLLDNLADIVDYWSLLYQRARAAAAERTASQRRASLQELTANLVEARREADVVVVIETFGAAAVGAKDIALTMDDEPPVVPLTALTVPIRWGAETRGQIVVTPATAAVAPSDLRANVTALADLAAQALERTRLAEREHEIAVSLQHAMLGRPDEIARADWGTAYRPADRGLEIGGDWYDLIALPNHQVALVVGDIVGHDLGAAAAMGQLRSAVRVLAPMVDDPAELLTQLDCLIENVDGAQGTTMVYAVLNCSTGELRYSCAGHLPPLVVNTEGVAHYLLEGRNGPLGGFIKRRRETATSVINVDDWLVLYSDGLIERRGESLDAGLERLAGAANALPTLPSGALCDALVAEMLEGVDQGDDVAVLAIRPLTDEIHLSRRANPETLLPTRRLLRSWLRAFDADCDDIEELVLGVGEAMTNAIEHAYTPGTQSTVELDAICHDGLVTITVRDHGAWRPPATLPDLRRGRGFMIMRNLADVAVHHNDDGTTVELRRRLSATTGSTR